MERKKRNNIILGSGGIVLAATIATSIAVPLSIKAKNKKNLSSNQVKIEELTKIITSEDVILDNKSLDDFSISISKQYENKDFEKMTNIKIPSGVILIAKVKNINLKIGKVYFDITLKAGSGNQAVSKKLEFMLSGFISKEEKIKLKNNIERTKLFSEIISFKVENKSHINSNKITKELVKKEIEKKYPQILIKKWNLDILDIKYRNGAIATTISIFKDKARSSTKEIIISGYMTDEKMAQNDVDNELNNFNESINSLIFKIKNKLDLPLKKSTNINILLSSLKTINPNFNYVFKGNGVKVYFDTIINDVKGTVKYEFTFKKDGAKPRKSSIIVSGYKTKIRTTLNQLKQKDINQQIINIAKNKKIDISSNVDVSDWITNNKKTIENNEFNITLNGTVFLYKITIDPITNDDTKKGIFTYSLNYLKNKNIDYKKELSQLLLNKLIFNGFKVSLTNEEKIAIINSNIKDISAHFLPTNSEVMKAISRRSPSINERQWGFKLSDFLKYRDSIKRSVVINIYRIIAEPLLTNLNFGAAISISNITPTKSATGVKFDLEYVIDNLKSNSIEVTLSGFQSLNNFKSYAISLFTKKIKDETKTIKLLENNHLKISQDIKNNWENIIPNFVNEINVPSITDKKAVSSLYSKWTKKIKEFAKNYNAAIENANTEYILSIANAQTEIDDTYIKEKLIIPSKYQIPDLNIEHDIVINDDNSKHEHKGKYKIISWNADDDNGSIAYEVVYSFAGQKSTPKKYIKIIDSSLKNKFGKFTKFLKQNDISVDNFSVNDFAEKPLIEMFKILLTISDKNLSIPSQKIKDFIELLPENTISNKAGFVKLLDYLFEYRIYNNVKTNNLKVISKIIGKNSGDREQNLQILLTKNENTFLKLIELLLKDDLDNDMLDIIANTIARLPMFSDKTIETTIKLVPFIKSAIPTVIDLLKSIKINGIKSIFDKHIPNELNFLNDINGTNKLISKPQKVLILNYLKVVEKDYPKYIKYFLGDKSLDKYVSSIKTIGEARGKLFSKFELALSSMAYMFIDQGVKEFGQMALIASSMLKSEVPVLIKTINQILVEGLLNQGDYSIRKFLVALNNKIGGLLSLADGVIPKNIKSIIDVVLGGGNKVQFNLLWSSIYDGFGTVVKNTLAKSNGDKDFNKFIANLIKLLSPSGYIKGKEGEKQSIDNDYFKVVINQLLNGFKTKKDFMVLIKKIIPSDILSKGAFSITLEGIIEETFEKGNYSVFLVGKLINIPKTIQMLKDGLLVQKKEDFIAVFKELKREVSGLNFIIKALLPDNVKLIIDKISNTKDQDFENIAVAIYKILNEGIDDLNKNEITSLLNLLKSFGIIKTEKDMAKVGESLITLINSGLINLDSQHITAIIDFIRIFAEIPIEYQGLIKFILNNWEAPISDKRETPVAKTNYQKKIKSLEVSKKINTIDSTDVIYQ